MKKIYLLGQLVLLLFILNKVSGQQINNLRVKTLEDKVNLFYDVTNEQAGQQFNIKILCSNNNGISFDVPVKTLKGDVGEHIEGGKDKIIIWDALNDITNLKGNYTFKIIAEPKEIKNQTDNVEGFHFELVDSYKKNNRIICVQKITNNGTKRK